MIKPRIFIGSSVEGLNVAYAVQQNLLHQAEVTVWDQGIFELSKTTIESLTIALNNSDFAVFVFSPDDLVHIRNVTKSSIRDNVLFEFGLFIGKLGRDRVFFLLPSTGELHLPTDLLGITAGRYESDRTDGSMQAATGSVSHQIRQQMKTLGLVPGRVNLDTSAESPASEDEKKQSWIQDFFDGQFEIAKLTLESALTEQTGDDALCTKASILLCELRHKGDGAITPLLDFAADNFESSRTQSTVASYLRLEGYLSEAIELLLNVRSKRPKDTKIAMALAKCHTDDNDVLGAIAELQRVGPENSPQVAIELADLYTQDNNNIESLKTIQRCYTKHPSNKELQYKYARIAQDLDEHEIAACLLDGLTKRDPTSVDYWGYLGNSCFQLELSDVALKAYRRAERNAIPGQTSQWIEANIGNLLLHSGLPSEACTYLESSLINESRSDYSHERLASALQKQALEEKEFQKKCAEGKRLIREKTAELLNTLDESK